jgi:hypothetical protein
MNKKIFSGKTQHCSSKIRPLQGYFAGFKKLSDVYAGIYNKLNEGRFFKYMPLVRDQTAALDPLKVYSTQNSSNKADTGQSPLVFETLISRN